MNPEYVDRALVSDRSKAAARVSAGTLLLQEAKARRWALTAIDASVDASIVEVTKAKRAGRTEKAFLLALLLAAARDASQRVRRALVDGRSAARDAASARLRVELSVAGLVLSPHVLAAGRGGDEDGHHASASADALAVAWRAQATHGLLRALRRDEDVVVSLDQARERMASRVRRTAATEVAQAYNDEHRVALERAIDLDDELAEEVASLRIVRVWDAILDRRTCDECAGHDGEMTTVGHPFSSGDEPGFMHPLCRCIDTVLALPMSATMPKAA